MQRTRQIALTVLAFAAAAAFRPAVACLTEEEVPLTNARRAYYEREIEHRNGDLEKAKEAEQRVAARLAAGSLDAPTREKLEVERADLQREARINERVAKRLQATLRSGREMRLVESGGMAARIPAGKDGKAEMAACR